MDKEVPLQRICTSCGLNKPLSAFLYISSTRGTTYGSLCSACRGTEMERKKITLGDEEGGSTSSRLRIGAREKILLDREKERKIEEKEQKTLEQKKKNEALKAFKTDQAEHILEEEKRHLPSKTIDPPWIEKTPVHAPPEPPKGQELPQEKITPDAILNPEKDREILLKSKKTKELKENKLAGALEFRDEQHATVSRSSVVTLGFLEFLGAASAAARGRSPKKRLGSSHLFNTSSAEKSAPENPLKIESEKNPGFQKKK